MRKKRNIVQRESRKIKNSILIFIIGNLFFLASCAGIAYYGVVCVIRFFTVWHLQILEKLSILIGLGGAILFVQIILQFFDKSPIPKNYQEITELTHPDLFCLITQIKDYINYHGQIRVFLTDSVSASVFILPDIRNILTIPERFLGIGRHLIENMPEQEIRAILFHEFAHLTQYEINDTSRASYIGQFANSFLSERIEYNNNYAIGNTTLFMMSFYYLFMDSLCQYIKKHYERLTDELEFVADDIAMKYVSPRILSEALQHIIRLSGKPELPESLRKRIERMETLPSSNIGDQKRNNEAKLKIRHSGRRHFFPFIDFKYPILLNGKTIGKGCYLKKFYIDIDVPPGVYTIDVFSYSTTLDAIPFSFEAETGWTYSIELDYKLHFWKSKYVIFCHKMDIYKN